jgi:phosphonatase-like hydrolase
MQVFAAVKKIFFPRIDLISKIMIGIQLVVFDMAGTTVRDRGNVAEAFINAFRENGIEIPFEEVKKVMGWRKIDAVKMLLQKFNTTGNNESLIHTIHETFIRNMIKHYEEDSILSPLPHVEETFAELKEKGVKIALNTGFPRSIADTILKRLHWEEGKTIDVVIASDEVPEGRPHPYMIRSIMKQLQVADSRSVAKVGDTQVDVEEGRSAGCGLVISVTTGAYSRGQLEQYKPDRIIDSMAELSSLIQ